MNVVLNQKIIKVLIKQKTIPCEVIDDGITITSQYNDSNVLKDSDTVSPVTDTNKLVTQEDVAIAGGGDMLTSIYDSDNNGKVNLAENAERVNGKQVMLDIIDNPISQIEIDDLWDIS